MSNRVEFRRSLLRRLRRTRAEIEQIFRDESYFNEQVLAPAGQEPLNCDRDGEDPGALSRNLAWIDQEIARFEEEERIEGGAA